MALGGVVATIGKDAASSTRHALQGSPEAFAGELAALAREIGSRTGLETLVGKTGQHAASSSGSTGSDMMPASSVITNALSGLMQSSGMADTSAANAAPTDTGTTAAAPGASDNPGSAGELSADDAQTLLQGDYSAAQPPSSSVTCPPDVSMDQLMSADGGLLGKMGNQTLTGKGADGISGGLKDNLARLAGGKPGDIGTNKDVTMRALMILESVKNIPGSDGKQLPDSVRHNGNLSGLNPNGEADDGSDVGYLQNLFKSPGYTLPTQRAVGDGHMKSNDTEESGAEMAGKKIEKVFKDIGIGLAMGLLALIPGVGEAADLGLGAAIGIGEGAADAAAAGGEAAAESAAEAGGEAAADGGSEAAGDSAGEAAGSGEPATTGGAASVEARLGTQTLNDLLGSDKFGSTTLDDLVGAMKTVKQGTDLAHKLDDIYQDVVNAQSGGGNQNPPADAPPDAQAA